jgi:hypothetical protein
LQERRQSEGEEDGERHHRTVERENLIRQEHGIEARGFRLRDPYCGNRSTGSGQILKVPFTGNLYITKERVRL